MDNAKLIEYQRELTHTLCSLRDMCDLIEKETRDFTPDEETRNTELLEQVKTLEGKIASEKSRLEQRKLISEKLAAMDKASGSEEGKITPQPEQRKSPSFEFAHGTVRNFKGPNAKENAYKSGMWFLATQLKNERALQWCKDNGVEVRALSGDVNSKGGALVPDEFASTIIDLREMYGVFRQNVNVVPMATDHKIFPRRTGGLTAYFLGDNDSFTESDTAWDNVTLTAKKLGTLTRMSSEVNEDSMISLMDWLAKEIAYALAFKEDTVGFMGDGSATNGGITGVLTAIEAQTGYVSYVNATSGTDTFAEVDVDDLTTLMGTLPQYARANAKWYCSQTAYDAIFTNLALSAGGNTMQTLNGAFAPSYAGYPIVVSQVFPTSSLNNQAMLLFGDLGAAAMMGDRRGIEIASSVDRYFDQDQIAIRGIERIDVNVHDIGSASVAGPVVALIGNT